MSQLHAEHSALHTLKLKYPSGTLKTWTWTAHSCVHADMIKKKKISHTHAGTYICWIRRILHGRLPNNTDENLDWTKLPALMKTNYLDDSQVCWYTAGKFNSMRHCTRWTRSCSAGNTKLTVAVLFPLQQKCHPTIRQMQPLLCPLKGQRSVQFSWENIVGVSPKWKQMSGHICGFIYWIKMWKFSPEEPFTHMQVRGGGNAGNDPPPAPHTLALLTSPVSAVISIPHPVPFPMAITQWCHEETRKAILTL